jgi:hypothetical protein
MTFIVLYIIIIYCTALVVGWHDGILNNIIITRLGGLMDRNYSGRNYISFGLVRSYHYIIYTLYAYTHTHTHTLGPGGTMRPLYIPCARKFIENNVTYTHTHIHNTYTYYLRM